MLVAAVGVERRAAGDRRARPRRRRRRHAGSDHHRRGAHRPRCCRRRPARRRTRCSTSWQASNRERSGLDARVSTLVVVGRRPRDDGRSARRPARRGRRRRSSFTGSLAAPQPVGHQAARARAHLHDLQYGGGDIERAVKQQLIDATKEQIVIDKAPLAGRPTRSAGRPRHGAAPTCSRPRHACPPSRRRWPTSAVPSMPTSCWRCRCSRRRRRADRERRRARVRRRPATHRSCSTVRSAAWRCTYATPTTSSSWPTTTHSRAGPCGRSPRRPA